MKNKSKTYGGKSIQRIDAEIHFKLKIMAIKKGVTMAELIRPKLEELVKRKK